MTIDLRTDHDERAAVPGGTLYRKGGVLQAWWDEHGRETWNLGTGALGLEQARDNYRAMLARWCERRQP